MKAFISISIGLLATVSTTAIAQVDTPAAPSPAADDGGIADIVVTATRREERLQKIPVTVTAISGEQLKSSGVIETRQLTQVVPGLVGSRNAGVNQPVIRGVGTGGVVGDESNVATYIDGIYQPDPWTTNLDLVEIQRVEVLRGPQGTLFGRNATGGLINVITPDPNFEFRGHVSGSVGVMRGAGDYDLRGYVTGGLSESIAMDFSALYKANDDYVTDVVRGGKRYGADEFYAFRSKILFKASDRTKFVLIGEYARRDGGSNVNQPFENNTIGAQFPNVILPTGPWQASLNYDPVLDMEKYSVSFQSKFDLGAINLETTSSYQHGEIGQAQDRDSSNIDIGVGEVFTTQRTFSQEIRLLSNTDASLTWLAGAFYYWSHLDGIIPTTAGGVTRTTSPDVGAESMSGFVEATYALTDTVFTTFGGRYTTETRTFEQASNGVPLFAPQKVTFDKFTYRAALRWQFDPRANFYLTYGTGFKSGVHNGVGTSPVPVRPENIRSIEGGIKADPARWLRANLSAFHYNYTDLQVSARDPVTGLVLLQNAADAEVYGGELELTIAPSRDLNLKGAFAYSHGTYQNFPFAQGFTADPNGGNSTVIVDASGNRITNAPRFTYNLAGEWAHDYDFGRLGTSLNFYHSAKVYYDVTNNFAQKGYAMINAEASFMPPSEAWRFSIGVTNLTNEVVFQSLRVGSRGTDGILERPREVKASVRFNF